LRQRVSELGLSGRVDIRGWSAPVEVAAFLQSLDALVLLTRTTKHVREQFGRVIIEAQACCVPVIGSTCGAIPSVVGDGGWIVPERDPEKLSDLLDRLAQDPGLVETKGLAARRNVEARFTYGAVATAVATACRAAAAANALPPPRS
jgi:glycosyltransferase involved in cell wall biosynthesis